MSATRGQRMARPAVLVAGLLLVAAALGAWIGRESFSLTGIQAQTTNSAHVVYFQIEPSAGDLTPQALAANLGAQTVATWQAVLDRHASVPIDILIVDPGSLNLVDWEWLRPEYRAGLMVVGIMVHLNVLGDRLAEPELAATPPESWNSEFYAFAHASHNGTPVALTAIAVDPDHEPTGTDWVNVYLNGDEAGTGPSAGGNIEPDTTAYFYRRIKLQLEQQAMLDGLTQP